MVFFADFHTLMTQPYLLITPSVPVWKADNNDLVFDRKFYDGMLLYRQKWPGILGCVMSLSPAPPPEFGLVAVKPAELPFTLTTLERGEAISARHLHGASIVLAAGDADNQLHVSRLCRDTGIKCVYIIEYIKETRYQIVALTTSNPIIRWRRMFYVGSKEKKRVSAFKLSDGLQCNGAPAFNEYAFAPNRLLYFDTRVYAAQIIDDEALKQRVAGLSENRPLRLAFSGRLIRMKGADHLPRLALKLQQLGTPFHLTIYGAGDLEAEMREAIAAHGLESLVSMPGAVDFYARLLPELKQSVDLFVCPHRQSDPSCTYLETLSCGLPIAGYGNRAFTGLLAMADVGWSAEMDDVDALAGLISHLHAQRTELQEKSLNSAAFARLHDFEATFQRRIDHLLATVNGVAVHQV